MLFLLWRVVDPEDIGGILLIAALITAAILGISKDPRHKNKFYQQNRRVIMRKTRCPYCGEEIIAGASKCRHCGEWLNPDDTQDANIGSSYTENEDYFRQDYASTDRPVFIQQTSVEGGGSNGIGVAGFIFSLLGLLLGWFPGLGKFVWFLGAIFSLIGLFKRPRGFAIVGLFISFIDIIIFGTLLSAIASIIS